MNLPQPTTRFISIADFSDRIDIITAFIYFMLFLMPCLNEYIPACFPQMGESLDSQSIISLYGFISASPR